MKLTDWISVDDRLPTEDNRYLVLIPTLDDDLPSIALAWYNPGPEYTIGWSLLPRPLLEAITHWMPLPEPPVAQSKPSEPTSDT